MLDCSWYVMRKGNAWLIFRYQAAGRSEGRLAADLLVTSAHGPHPTL